MTNSNVSEIDSEMAALRRRLMQLQKAKVRLKPKPVSTKPVGRPAIDPERIKKAKLLAREFPIPNVALVTGISIRCLYKYGIKRYRLNAEMAAERERKALA